MKQKKLYFKKETFQRLGLGGRVSGFSFDMLVLFLQGACHYGSYWDITSNDVDFLIYLKNNFDGVEVISEL